MERTDDHIPMEYLQDKTCADSNHLIHFDIFNIIALTSP